jgi:hypothetical protein
LKRNAVAAANFLCHHPRSFFRSVARSDGITRAMSLKRMLELKGTKRDVLRGAAGLKRW